MSQRAAGQAPESHVKGVLLDEAGVVEGKGARLFSSKAAFMAAVREAGELEEYERMVVSLQPAQLPAPPAKDEWEEPQAEAAEVM